MHRLRMLLAHAVVAGMIGVAAMVASSGISAPIRVSEALLSCRETRWALPVFPETVMPGIAADVPVPPSLTTPYIPATTAAMLSGFQV